MGGLDISGMTPMPTAASDDDRDGQLTTAHADGPTGVDGR